MKSRGGISHEGSLQPREETGKPGQPLNQDQSVWEKRHPVPALEMREQISVLSNDYERWWQVRGGWRGHHKPQGYMAEPTAGTLSEGRPSTLCEVVWPLHLMPFKVEELSKKSPCS